MIGDDQGNLHWQLTALNTPQQILQAVALLAGKNRHTRKGVGKMELRLPTKPFSQGLSCLGKRIPRNAKALELPFNAAEKQPRSGVGVVIGMANAAAIGCHPTR